MAKLTKAVDLQARHDEILMLKESCFCTFEEDEVFQLHERIDDLMGKNAALTAENERLITERDVTLRAVTQICPMFEVQSITARVLAARAAAPAEATVKQESEPVRFMGFSGNLMVFSDSPLLAATPTNGAEQVHAPKTIVPEPDQRRIETERVPQKGGE